MEAFYYIKYTVISTNPESDAIDHVKMWAKELGIQNPQIIGWDFPYLSQEQINVFNMHGYEAALILNEELQKDDRKTEVIRQERHEYLAITIKQPEIAPFCLIPNAYKVLMTHMKVNGIKHKRDKNMINCFEKEYDVEGIHYMDVYIAVEPYS